METNERERVLRILIGEMVHCIVCAKSWRETKAPNREELAKEFDVQLQGLARFAIHTFGGFRDRDEVIAYAKKCAPWCPAHEEGLRTLKELKIW